MFRKLVGLAVVASLFFAGSAFAQGISGSAHDFSDDTGTWNPDGEICAVCHVPHSSDTSVTDAALWDHELTVATYQLYNTAYRSTIQGTVTPPGGLSKLCLSCHDGTVGLDSFGAVKDAGGSTNFIQVYNAAANVSTNLQDDHPVSITYEFGVDLDLKDPAGHTNVKLSTSNTVECTSCHNVHNESGNPTLLVADNTASAMCLECHSK